MKCASDLYIDFALEVGAIGKITAQQHTDTIDNALKSVIRAQEQYQKDSDEVQVFFNLLRSCFAGGEVHVSDYLTQGTPKYHPFVWGWRSSTEAHYTEHISSKKEDQGKSSKEEAEDETEQKRDVLFPAGKGLNIGNIKQMPDKDNSDKENKLASELWLDPLNTFRYIQKLAMAQDDRFPLKKHTLWRRLMNEGKLLKTTFEKGKERPDYRVQVAGSKKWVIIISSALVMDAWGDDDNNAG